MSEGEPDVPTPLLLDSATPSTARVLSASPAVHAGQIRSLVSTMFNL